MGFLNDMMEGIGGFFDSEGNGVWRDDAGTPCIREPLTDDKLRELERMLDAGDTYHIYFAESVVPDYSKVWKEDEQEVIQDYFPPPDSLPADVSRKDPNSIMGMSYINFGLVLVGGYTLWKTFSK